MNKEINLTLKITYNNEKFIDLEMGNDIKKDSIFMNEKQFKTQGFMDKIYCTLYNKLKNMIP